MQFRDKLGDKVIIIPRGESESESVKKYSNLGFLPCSLAKTVTWINRDRISHALTSGEPNSIVSNKIFNTGLIPAGKSGTVTIPSTRGNIPYFCSLHPSEKGTIVVISKDENSLSTAERLELLDTASLSEILQSVMLCALPTKRHFHPKTLKNRRSGFSKDS